MWCEQRRATLGGLAITIAVTGKPSLVL